MMRKRKLCTTIKPAGFKDVRAKVEAAELKESGRNVPTSSKHEQRKIWKKREERMYINIL